MIEKTLLDKFLKNECNAAERALVLKYLDTHPGEIEAYLAEEAAGTEKENAEPWETERSEQTFATIQQRITRKPMTRRIVAWSLAAAAAAILFLALPWLIRGGRIRSANQGLATTRTDTKTPDEEWLQQVNNTTDVKTFNLPDGTMAELAPGTRIEYRQSFAANNRRLVRLAGEAQFDVAKDPANPFILASGDLSTTVLGTIFSVTAYPDSATIQVHLYSGRVLTEARSGFATRLGKGIYLQPGDVLTYNRHLLTASVRSMKKNNRADVAISTHRKARSTTQPNWYMFGGQPLAQVFDQLSDYYGVEINYFPSDVSNRYFTGKFSKTDAIESILKDISLMHGLTLKKVEGVFVFRKKDH